MDHAKRILLDTLLCGYGDGLMNWERHLAALCVAMFNVNRDWARFHAMMLNEELAQEFGEEFRVKSSDPEEDDSTALVLAVSDVCILIGDNKPIEHLMNNPLRLKAWHLRYIQIAYDVARSKFDPMDTSAYGPIKLRPKDMTAATLASFFMDFHKQYLPPFDLERHPNLTPVLVRQGLFRSGL